MICVLAWECLTTCAGDRCGRRSPPPTSGPGYYHREIMAILHNRSCVYVHYARQSGKVLGGDSLCCPPTQIIGGHVLSTVAAPMLQLHYVLTGSGGGDRSDCTEHADNGSKSH